MLDRRLYNTALDFLEQFPALALIGPRQVGKTTLARRIARDRQALYLDLELEADREKLADPTLYLRAHRDKLVIIDEIHRLPDLFHALRSLIDEGRRQGRGAGQFLILGSASMDLLRQSGESLAGRIAYVELTPIDVLEVPASDREALWLRGGFPDSLLASSDARSLRWRQNFVRSYLERDIPDLAPRVPTEIVRRLWTMLAHAQATLLNAAQLARALAVDGKTVANHIDLLVDLLLVRRLKPFHSNLGKRLVRSPKTYIRDSGILHAQLGIANRDVLYGHPLVGASWEGFVIETLINAAPAGSHPYFYRTAAGAEIDLLLELPAGELWAIEIKRGLTAKVERGFHLACEDLQPARRFVVYSGDQRHPKPQGVEAIGFAEIATLLIERG